MKKVLTLLLAILLITLTSCGKSNNPSTQPTTDEPSTTITTPSDDNPTTTTEEEDETANMTLTLKIGSTLVDVFWLDNESVKDLIYRRLRRGAPAALQRIPRRAAAPGRADETHDRIYRIGTADQSHPHGRSAVSG